MPRSCPSLDPISRQKSESGSKIFATAPKPLHVPETAVVRRGWVTAEIRLREYLKKSSLFSHPFCPYWPAIVLEAEQSRAVSWMLHSSKEKGRTDTAGGFKATRDARGEVTITFWATPGYNITMQSLDTPYKYLKLQNTFVVCLS